MVICECLNITRHCLQIVSHLQERLPELYNAKRHIVIVNIITHVKQPYLLQVIWNALEMRTLTLFRSDIFWMILSIENIMLHMAFNKFDESSKYYMFDMKSSNNKEIYDVEVKVTPKSTSQRKTLVSNWHTFFHVFGVSVPTYLHRVEFLPHYA